MVLCLNGMGCGYQFTVEGPGPVIGGSEGRLQEGPPVRLAVHTLKNNTFEPALEFKYTRIIRRAFKAGGGVTLVDDDPSADFVLEGTIISVTYPSLAFTPTDTQESRVQVKVAVKVKDRETGKVRWSQTGTSTAEFYVGSTSTGVQQTGLQFNRALQDRAIEQAGLLLAVDLADGFLIARDRGKFQVGEKKDNPAPSLKGRESS